MTQDLLSQQFICIAADDYAIQQYVFGGMTALLVVSLLALAYLAYCRSIVR